MRQRDYDPGNVKSGQFKFKASPAWIALAKAAARARGLSLGNYIRTLIDNDNRKAGQ